MSYSIENRRVSIASRLQDWSHHAGLIEKLLASVLFATLMALAAQLRFPLPFTPVPLTGQVLVVLLAGFVLERWAGVSMGFYLLFGSVGGWFSGLVGLAAFSGTTAGYLFGFVAAAGLVGEIARRRKAWSYRQIVLVMGAGQSVIYALGAAWLILAFHLSPGEAVLVGVVPFLAADAAKIGLATAAASLLTPRRVPAQP